MDEWSLANEGDIRNQRGKEETDKTVLLSQLLNCLVVVISAKIRSCDVVGIGWCWREALIRARGRQLKHG